MIRFLLLGYGHIGQRHASIINAHPEAELVGIIEVDPAKTTQLHNAFPTWEAWQNAGIKANIAIIALPNGLHISYAIRAIDADMHVLVEKPMGLKAIDCQHLIDRAEQKDKKLFVVKQNRYSPPSMWMKQLIDSGKLGQIYEVHIRCFWNRDDRYYQKGPKSETDWRGSQFYDGGVLFTQFSHFIDVMYWVFGDIHNIQTRLFNHNHSGNTEFPDSGMVHFDFQKGGAGSLQFSTSVFEENMESSTTVLAEKGAFKVGGQYMERIEFVQIADYQMPQLSAAEPPNNYGTYKGSAGNHAHVIQNVIDTLKNRAEIATGGEDGMKVVDIIERIYAAQRPPEIR